MSKKNDKVTVLEDEDDWQKVATADGFIGYLKSSKLKDQKKEKNFQRFCGAGIYKYFKRL